jgi:hypothetical protein
MKNMKAEDLIRVFVMLGAAVSFLWGVVIYLDSKKIESTKPFLEKQLALYSEATRTTAIISTSNDDKELNVARLKFWRLYWGELALVENREVESAMKRFGDALLLDANQSKLQNLSLGLAEACRYSLDKSWGINAWNNPDVASETAVAN